MLWVLTIIAATPVLETHAATWGKGELIIDVQVLPSTDGAAVKLQPPPGKKWCEAVRIAVEDANGALLAWPLVREGTCDPTLDLRAGTTGDVSFKLEAAVTRKLASGVYTMTASLELPRGDPANFSGTVRAVPFALKIGTSDPVTVSKSLDATIDALMSGISSTPRTDLVLALEDALLDAPELSMSPTLDELVGLHLQELARRMAAPGSLYSSQFRSAHPHNDFLTKAAVLLSPGRVSNAYMIQLTPSGAKPKIKYDVGVRAAPNAAVFWRWVLDSKECGIHLYAAHGRDSVVRIATSTVLPTGAEHFQHISFWKHQDAGWKLLSFEPVSPGTEVSQWHSNVHHAGPPPMTPAALTDTEKKQWLEATFDLFGLTAEQANEKARTASAITTGTGADELDASYLPFLHRYLGKGTPEQRAAIYFAISKLGGEADPEPMVDLLRSGTVKSAESTLFFAAEMQVKKLFEGSARAATESELEAIRSIEETAQVQFKGREPPLPSARINGRFAMADLRYPYKHQQAYFYDGDRWWTLQRRFGPATLPDAGR